MQLSCVNLFFEYICPETSTFNFREHDKQGKHF